jgi:hypothetical protein
LLKPQQPTQNALYPDTAWDTEVESGGPQLEETEEPGTIFSQKNPNLRKIAIDKRHHFAFT